jgi:hypothetical protein
MVTWMRRMAGLVAGFVARLFGRKAKPAPVVLGLVVPEGPLAEPLTGRVLCFRGCEWHQQGPADAKGKLTFVRETAVGGRPVLVEAQVLEADLEVRPDGTLTLRGRE